VIPAGTPLEHVYFDHNATTPVDERVLEAMLPFLRGRYGNASSRHELGTVARRAVDAAREQVAALVNVRPSQVIFVSGGTEANNAFIKGTASYLKPSQVAVSAIEHPCVAKPAQELARAGWKLRKLAVTGDGVLDLADLETALREPTGLVSVMLANNETGVVQDVAGAGERARRARAWMHTDAVQALGKIPVDFPSLNVHAMTLSAHKIYGPKGAGALIVDKRRAPAPHPRRRPRAGLRSGTENVPPSSDLARRASLPQARLGELAPRLGALRPPGAGTAGHGAVIFGAAAPHLIRPISHSIARRETL
jgi:cysteine desulfurase